MKFRHRLGVKIIAMMGLILLITAISMIWYIAREDRDLLLQGARQHTWSIGQTAAAFIVDPLLTKDYPVIQDYINHLVSIFPLIQSISVVREDGKLIAHTETKPLPTTSTRSKVKDTDSIGSSSDQYFFTIDIKLDDNSSFSLGKLTIRTSLREIHLAIRKQVTEISLALSVVFVSLLGAMAFIMRIWVLDPLDTMANFTQKISCGHMDHQIDHFRKDEFGSLMDHFNQMADKLTKSYAELEQKVDERTRELREAQKELVRKEKLATLGQLTAIVSHELRNPLSTISSSLYSIRKRLKGMELEVIRALDRAERNVTRCDNIIDELLDYTRITKLNLESTNIDKWVGELLDEQAISDVFSLDKKLVAGISIPVDRERLRRCLINIFNNAAESIVTKEVLSDQERLSVGTHLDSGRLIIEFIDTGSGIPKDELKNIFDPLFSTKSFGIGLGLPIAKQIIEQHNGGISIDSRAGKGTTTTLWLPANHADASKYG